MSKYRIVCYDETMHKVWNDFLKFCKNQHFMFSRLYIAYHGERFIDYSLMIYKVNRLVALCPAVKKDDVFYTHPGLTFGGLLYTNHMTCEQMLYIFKILFNFLKKRNFKKMIYKAVPYIYYDIPAQEDIYTLFRFDAILFRKDSATVIFLTKPMKYRKDRRENIRKAKRNNLNIEKSENYPEFWIILTEQLKKKYNVQPIHSLSEITLLANCFPKNIHLYLCKQENEILAGMVIYENPNIVHVQYMNVNEKGREIGALDFLIDKLIVNFSKNKNYFSFGISTEKDGKYLNNSLISFKEGFGGGTVTHDFYTLNI